LSKLYFGLDDAKYNAIPAIRATALKAGVRSMRAMRHTMTRNGKEPTAAMIDGSLMHIGASDPEALDHIAAVWDGGRRQGKDWKLFEADNQDKLITTQARLDVVKEQLAHIKLDPVSGPIMNQILETEVCAQWTDPLYGPGKCKFDGLGQHFFVDFKSASEVKHHKFMSNGETLGYPLQFGWYGNGWREAAAKSFGELHHAYCIVIGTKDELDVVVYELSLDKITDAYERTRKDPDEPRVWMGAREIACEYRACCATESWPGQANNRILQWERPAWASRPPDPVQLTIGGEKVTL